MKPLLATARLQFHKDFTLPDARAVVPYLAELGITHLYASPLLKARPGSTHGYDIVDHNQINPELGGEPALRELVATLRAHGMGLILDIVPNHMGVGGADNAWWLDVLEWGRTSPYATYFDIDWDPPNPALRNRLLAPFLGAPYGTCLARGEIALHFDPEDGRIFAGYAEHRFPINPRDYPAILADHPALAEIAARFAALGPAGGSARETVRAAAAEARLALSAPARREAVAAALAAFRAQGPERLHRLLERQAFRLAWWRAAADEINWRRFFDINGLAGIRVELPEVFDATHETVLRLYAEGLIDGVRIDHIDGLADPRGYGRKLRRRLATAARGRDPALDRAPAVIWVEKILAPHERLPTDWLTDGTTGYDFMNEAAAVLHAPAGEAPLTTLWTGLTGRPAAFAAEAEAARRQILAESLASELLHAAAALHRLGQRDTATRDWTLTSLHRAVTEVLVHFPSYRIYAGLAGASAPDARALDRAFAGAARTLRRADRDLLGLLRGWLAGDDLRATPAGARRAEHLRAMVRFQQLSAPTAAKSVEDTAFYRYGRLLSRNEVGSEPSQFALAPAAFHAAQAARHKAHPRALLATATHDHKRGEDTRLRLAVLSEIPEEWEAALARWMRLNASLRRDLDGPAPDAADEVMLYETLVAAWPLTLVPGDREGMAAYIARVQAWQTKALREAKRHTGWAAPDTAYEQAAAEFLTQMLDPGRSAPVAQEIATFAGRIAPAGALNGLAQLVLRLAAPGIPDLYQGTEFWDLSLVDPDNRRPVDFAARAAALAAAAPPATLLATWRDGRVKQAVLARALALRQRAAPVFARGGYEALKTEGPLSDHILAFARVHEGRAVIAIATRLAARLPGTDRTPLVETTAWDETSVLLPRHLARRPLRDALGGQGVPHHQLRGSGRVLARDLLHALPVALLEAE